MDELALSLQESQRLADCEKIIESGFQTFVDVGNALLEIRDSRLYRQDFDTFEEYCRERWKMTKPHAHRLICAAETVANLVPVGTVPTTERQVRPLSKLAPDQQREAWSIASRISPSPTAAQVEEVAKTIERAINQAIKDTECERPQIKTNGEKRPISDTRWIEFFGAIGQLLRIDPFDSENILNRYAELHDDPQTVSEDLTHCLLAIDRIKKVKAELSRRFPNV